ncbi:Hypothetical predicted protein [Olea europaea subsp. europaea]|uniref:Uncharacterized protein n=1 Tax=Olea europaea subsp. europaea TaxID=158383 RepID=A0A8S0QRB0_OLEEU|nr:Hypothetical predicted protein [Olea europaea subsp. europaea]
MSKTWQGHNLIFWHFNAVSGTRCTGHVRDAFGLRQGRNLIFRLLGKFLDTVCKACLGKVCKPCSGHILAMVLFGICSGHNRDAGRFSGTRRQDDLLAMLGIQALCHSMLGMGPSRDRKAT